MSVQGRSRTFAHVSSSDGGSRKHDDDTEHKYTRRPTDIPVTYTVDSAVKHQIRYSKEPQFEINPKRDSKHRSQEPRKEYKDRNRSHQDKSVNVTVDDFKVWMKLVQAIAQIIARDSGNKGRELEKREHEIVKTLRQRHKIGRKEYRVAKYDGLFRYIESVMDVITEADLKRIYGTSWPSERLFDEGQTRVMNSLEATYQADSVKRHMMDDYEMDEKLRQLEDAGFAIERKREDYHDSHHGKSKQDKHASESSKSHEKRPTQDTRKHSSRKQSSTRKNETPPPKLERRRTEREIDIDSDEFTEQFKSQNFFDEGLPRHNTGHSRSRSTRAHYARSGDNYYEKSNDDYSGKSADDYHKRYRDDYHERYRDDYHERYRGDYHEGYRDDDRERYRDDYDERYRDDYDDRSYNQNYRWSHEPSYTAPPETEPTRDLRTHFEVLGVPQTATKIQVVKAWKEKQREVHPDRQQGKSDEQKAQAALESQRLNAAKDCLIDESKVS